MRSSDSSHSLLQCAPVIQYSQELFALAVTTAAHANTTISVTNQLQQCCPTFGQKLGSLQSPSATHCPEPPPLPTQSAFLVMLQAAAAVPPAEQQAPAQNILLLQAFGSDLHSPPAAVQLSLSAFEEHVKSLLQQEPVSCGAARVCTAVHSI